MNERLKQLRKALGLTQQEFADKIGSKRNTIAKYETNTNVPSTAVVSLICRVFNVNKEWIKSGEGEMFIPITRNDEIADLTAKLFKEEPDSFKSRVFFTLAKLDESEWEMLEKIALDILKGKK